MKVPHTGLLPRVLAAIALGILAGLFFPQWAVKAFMTFNAVFGQFLGFLIPLIIVGLVAPAIADLGKGAGKMLVITVLIAYADTVLAGLLAYGTGSWLFPSMVGAAPSQVERMQSVEPYFSIDIPPMFPVMTGLVFAFLMGLMMAATKTPLLKDAFHEFREIIAVTISKAIVPLLPLYIFGIFLNMTYTGQVWHTLGVFFKVILVIIVLHLLIILYLYLAAGAASHKNPFRLLWNMIPAYLTALGTSSSAATIPVTLKQSLKNGVREEIAGFTVPLCATIHMPGSAMKITACALTVCLMSGMPHSFPLFLEFVMMLGIMMVAAPGVPGGAIMAALAPLGSILGFGAEAQALMIALYIAMDSFGTACNVTGDGALAIMMDRIFSRKRSAVA
ncbi:MAG: dicarboxylate/amino acid:cation symporter [Bacteroidales bacterium]|nr:dicarboxylate/amino acid:cation symporter [Bacteroidales bacterium]